MRMLIPMSSTWTRPRRSLSPNLMGDVFDDFNHMVDQFFDDRPLRAQSFQASCDISETKNHFLITFDVPGIKKENIKIESHGNQLSISGERKREAKTDDENTTWRHERSYGRFERTFTLPNNVNAEKIEAHYEDGVLTVALPKVAEEKGRSIPIQSGQTGFLDKLFGSKKSEKDLKDLSAS